MPERLLESKHASEVAEGDALMAQLEELTVEARRIAAKAEEGGDLRAALGGLREVCRHLELLSRLQRDGGGGLLKLSTVQAMLQAAALSVAKHVTDPVVLDKIQADWDRIQ